MTVLVIGGGASGMAAALTAAEAGHRVLLAERQSRVGRKLLATGNGRCNLSNLHASPAHYHGAAVDFCRPALECFPSEETLGWFERLLRGEALGGDARLVRAARPVDRGGAVGAGLSREQHGGLGARCAALRA